MSIAVAAYGEAVQEAHEGLKCEAVAASTLQPDHLADWQALASIASPFSFFQHEGFIKALDEADAELLFVKDGEKTQAVMPFVMERRSGRTTVCQPGAPITQYNTLLAEPDADGHEIVDAVLDYFRHQRHADAIRLERVPVGSAFLAHPDFQSRTANPQEAPIERLKGKTAICPSGNASVKRLKRKLRKLEESGQVQFHTLDAAHAPQEWVDWAIAQKQAWLSEKGDTSRLFSDTEALKRFRALFGDNAPEGAKVLAVTVDDALLAVHLIFASAKAEHLYLTVYDMAYHRHSPSALLTLLQCERALAEGVEVFDMMPPFFDYKKDWCSESVKVVDVFVPLTFKGRMSLDHGVHRFKPSIRKVFNLLPEKTRKAIISIFAGYTPSRRTSEISGLTSMSGAIQGHLYLSPIFGTDR